MEAFNSTYLLDYRELMAFAFSYAIDLKDIDIDVFEKEFSNFEYLYLIEKGDIHYISGVSGIELIHEIFPNLEIDYKKLDLYFISDVYWAGYYLSYYQWKSGYSYKEIFSHIPLKVIVALYHPYHEMDESHFVEFMDMQMNKKLTIALKRLRKAANLTQKELAEKSRVSLRMIKAYEQGEQDIKKAEVETVIKLADALNCNVKDIVKI